MSKCFASTLLMATMIAGMHLRVRTMEFNGLDLTKEHFLGMLKERFKSADINSVKTDVIPYIINKRELDIWSNDYFVKLADMIEFE